MSWVLKRQEGVGGGRPARQEQTGYVEEKGVTRGGTGVGGTRLPRVWPSAMM